MARAKQPLRGSVTQNNPSRGRAQQTSPWLGFGARLALLIAAACFLIIGAAWLLRSGWPEKQETRLVEGALHLTKKASFAVKDIAVEGRVHTDKNQLYAALGASASMPILAFDPTEAAARVRALPWVEDVTIERRLPDALFVKLTERVPAARWQHEGKIVVIDRTGKELNAVAPESFAQLPLVVGDDAPENTQELLKALQDFPEIGAALKAAGRVGERRWDLYLQPKVVVHLPEEDLHGALARLEKLMKDQKILDRAIVAIDLRVADRLVIEPAPEAAATETKESPR
jgi:cell division protein FtsQ